MLAHKTTGRISLFAGSLLLLCAALMATSKAGAQSTSTPTVQVLQIVPNDDSVQITVAPVAGAADYRVYDVTVPQQKKYSGGSLTIEWNGVNPATGANLMIEAVDALGPYAPHKLNPDGSGCIAGMTGCPCCQSAGAHSTCKCPASINGHGDPGNTPNVVASFGPFHVTTAPRSLSGQQAFFDNFGTPEAFTPVSPNPQILSYQLGSYYQYNSRNWIAGFYRQRSEDADIFVDHRHLMTINADGLYVAYASVALEPRAAADISGGNMIHATWEVDSHFAEDLRRWCDLVVAPDGQPLTDAAVMDAVWFQHPLGTLTQAVAFHTDAVNALVFDWLPNGGAPQQVGSFGRSLWNYTPVLNDTQTSLDFRHRFDAYLSATHVKLLEEGKVLIDQDLPQPLAFKKLRLYFISQLYHSALMLQELQQDFSYETYWIDRTPYIDERHWDNMGFEVLPAATMSLVPGVTTSGSAVVWGDEVNNGTDFGIQVNASLASGAPSGTIQMVWPGNAVTEPVDTLTFTSPLEATAAGPWTWNGQPCRINLSLLSAKLAPPNGAVGWVVTDLNGNTIANSGAPGQLANGIVSIAAIH